ncbi:MAG: TolC family protein, partial [Bacteroidota bacterium]
MYRNFLRLLMLCIAWLSPPPLVAQTDSLDMFTVIDIAREQSLPALQAKNTYLKAYWSFKVFQASLKPGLTLGTTPVSYYRTVTQRYDSELNQDVFKLQQTLYHQATLSLSQQVSATGGQFFLESDVGRLQSFGDQGSANWSVTPVRIGYSQALLGFNGLKWDKKLRPAEYDLAKRQYTEALEYAALDALTYFFDLMLAEAGLALAEGNLMLRDSMLINGKRRHALGTLPLDDLLQLESSTLEASMSLAEAQMNQQQQQRKLAIFLRMDSLQAPLKAPNRLPSAPLSVERALTAYQAFHPQSLSFILQQLEAVRAEEQARKEQHFQANLQASIGLNQSNPNLNTALGNLLDQEQVLIGVSIPLLDWGQRKGMVKIATSERALVAVSIE